MHLRLNLTIGLAALTSACGPTPAATQATLATDQVIVAHRGASGHAPEHTFPAWDQALAMGAEYIEQDVLPTADGVLVVIHDDTLDRTARGPAENCSGRVDSKTLSQLKTCDMGSWFNETYPDRARAEYVGLPIATLEEVFQRYGKSVNYYIEIKPNSTANGDVEQQLLDLIDRYGLYEGAVNSRQVLIQSFIPSSLLTVQALDASLPLVQLYPAGGFNPGTIEAAASYSFGVGPAQADASQANIDYAHSLGLAVHPYTINSEADLQAMAARCVDGLFTNFPDRYRAVLAAEDIYCPAPIR